MSKPQDRTIYKNEVGKWVNEKHEAGRASTLHDTQEEAYEAAKEMLQNQGGGEISIKGLNGEIREKNTIAPGNDPVSIEG
jgi:hypothetical protein